QVVQQQRGAGDGVACRLATSQTVHQVERVLIEQHLLVARPGAATSMAGYSRRSASARLSRNSMLPVPLNSSKTTSSSRLPVSTRQVATMVKLGPASVARAAPKMRRTGASAPAATPPERVRPAARPRAARLRAPARP